MRVRTRGLVPLQWHLRGEPTLPELLFAEECMCSVCVHVNISQHWSSCWGSECVRLMLLSVCVCVRVCVCVLSRVVNPLKK